MRAPSAGLQPQNPASLPVPSEFACTLRSCPANGDGQQQRDPYGFLGRHHPGMTMCSPPGALSILKRTRAVGWCPAEPQHVLESAGGVGTLL